MNNTDIEKMKVHKYFIMLFTNQICSLKNWQLRNKSMSEHYLNFYLRKDVFTLPNRSNT